VTPPTSSRHRLAQTILGLVGLSDLVVIGWGLAEVLRYLRAHAAGISLPGGLRQDGYVTGVAVTVEVVVVLLMVLLALVGRIDIGGRRTPR